MSWLAGVHTFGGGFALGTQSFPSMGVSAKKQLSEPAPSHWQRRWIRLTPRFPLQPPSMVVSQIQSGLICQAGLTPARGPCGTGDQTPPRKAWRRALGVWLSRAVQERPVATHLRGNYRPSA